METTTQITIDMLTQDSVSIVTKRFIEADGRQYQLGDNHRAAYVNSEADRQRVTADLDGFPAQLKAVMAVWGESPTVVEETPENK